MARKKKSPLDEQVESNDTITIAEVKQFILDVKKKRDETWLPIAERSWNEIKKRNKKGGLYGGNNLDATRKWTKFPLWWSAWKIRQPITLARLAIPVLKDTQGDDPFGRTACIIGERLTRGILKTFDAFSEFTSSNDDFLITNFGWGRVFYRNELCEEDEKIRLTAIQPQQEEPIEGQPPPAPQQPSYVTPAGEEVSQPLFDEFGPYVLSGSKVSVDNEEVYFESGLYCNLYVDPSVTKWSKVTRLACEYEYQYREFKKKFGQAAVDKLKVSDLEEHKSGRKPITVFEYWDKFLKEVRWFAENSEDFFQPADMPAGAMSTLDNADGIEEVKKESYDNSDLYGLSNFFPCTEPLIINQSTDEFWPTSEYFQVQDILDDVHQIVSRMILLTKAIRVKFLFDSSVPELQSLINDVGEAGGLGVPNLQQALINGKSTLATLVAYFPVDEMIQGLEGMYKAFAQRLDMFFQITGLNDILRGQASDVQKTFGERQMEGKYALNRIEPYQRKVQEWMKNNYQLLMEMGLKMFSDDTLDQYVTPQTLDQEDKQRYTAALELLRHNKRRRFRVDFETDATININEQWRKQQATELANVLTKAMESTAKTAETQPELAAAELKVLKHLIGEFSDGKLFLDEIQDAIEKVIEKVSQPKPPEPNVDLERLKQDGQKIILEDKFRIMQARMTQALEAAKLQQKAQVDSINQQLAQIKIQIDNGANQQDLQLAVTKLQADIAQGWEALNLKKTEMLQAAQTEGGKANLEQFRLMIDARVRNQELTLEQAAQAVDEFRARIEAADYHASLQERIATEQRLQEEHQGNKTAQLIDSAASLMDSMKPEPEKAAPVTFDLSKTVHVKPPTEKPAKKK